MKINLYNKMRDDEKLQYIRELERFNEQLELCNYIKNNFIETFESLYRISKDLSREENLKCNAFNRFCDYIVALEKKYDMYPTPTCERTGEEKYE